MASAATVAAQNALKSYQGVGSATAIGQSEQKYGVPDSQARLSALKGIVGGLQSSVEAVDPSVTGRTAGTFTTEGQRQALVAKERAPILTDLGKQQSVYSSEAQDLTQKQSLASQMASALVSDDRQKYQRLLDQYNQATAQDTAAEQKRQAELQRKQWEKQFAESRRQFEVTKSENARQFNISAAQRAAAAAASAPQVNPGQEFLDYIANQFKSAGGAGNSKVSRQTQDAWANAWFKQNGVTNANRQQYWNLFNKTYNRVDNPTKDWRYAR